MAVELEKLLGVVALWEIVSVPVPAVYCAAVPVTAVIVVFAGMPLPTMICPTVGTVEKEALETVVDPSSCGPEIGQRYDVVGLRRRCVAIIVSDVGGVPVVLVT